jgi:hypothetical protein
MNDRIRRKAGIGVESAVLMVDGSSFSKTHFLIGGGVAVPVVAQSRAAIACGASGRK